MGVVILTPGEMVMENMALAVFDAESVTVTPKVGVPVAVGLPLRTPAAERASPPGKAEPPEFTGDPSEFEAFIDRNFPRGKFASLRRNLDKAARRKVITPVALYNHIVRIGRLLRMVITINDELARLKFKCPLLRICECGKIFEPPRKDQESCSTTCRDRFRQARWRADQERYKRNRIRKQNEREEQRKAR